MIAARQELDLRPQLERLDRLICRSEDIDEGTLTFAFRPLWQLDEPAKAALALQKAQATQVYTGLKLWPDAVVAQLAEAQLAADGTYPNAAAVFAEGGATNPASASLTLDYDPAQPRDLCGRWTSIGAGDLPEASITRPPGKPAGPSASVAQVFPPDIFSEDPPVVPDPGIPYPTDPTLRPGPDDVWRGPPGSMPGDPRGSWFNPKTGESLHPDLDHEPGVDPHYDYKIRRFKNKGWRWFPYGMVPKA